MNYQKILEIFLAYISSGFVLAILGVIIVSVVFLLINKAHSNKNKPSLEEINEEGFFETLKELEKHLIQENEEVQINPKELEKKIKAIQSEVKKEILKIEKYFQISSLLKEQNKTLKELEKIKQKHYPKYLNYITTDDFVDSKKKSSRLIVIHNLFLNHQEEKIMFLKEKLKELQNHSKELEKIDDFIIKNNLNELDIEQYKNYKKTLEKFKIIFSIFNSLKSEKQKEILVLLKEELENSKNNNIEKINKIKNLIEEMEKLNQDIEEKINKFFKIEDQLKLKIQETKNTSTQSLFLSTLYLNLLSKKDENLFSDGSTDKTILVNFYSFLSLILEDEIYITNEELISYIKEINTQSHIDLQTLLSKSNKLKKVMFLTPENKEEVIKNIAIEEAKQEHLSLSKHFTEEEKQGIKDVAKNVKNIEKKVEKKKALKETINKTKNKGEVVEEKKENKAIQNKNEDINFNQNKNTMEDVKTELFPSVKTELLDELKKEKEVLQTQTNNIPQTTQKNSQEKENSNPNKNIDVEQNIAEIIDVVIFNMLRTNVNNEYFFLEEKELNDVFSFPKEWIFNLNKYLNNKTENINETILDKKELITIYASLFKKPSIDLINNLSIEKANEFIEKISNTFMEYKIDEWEFGTIRKSFSLTLSKE